MADESLSLDEHLKQWRTARDTVPVEGVVQEEGDWLVINPDPLRPGVLYRVRRDDAPGPHQPSRMVKGGGQTHQLQTVRIKKDAAVVRIDIVSPAHLSVGNGTSKPLGTITAFFSNGDSTRKHWVVRDQRSGTIVVNRILQPDEEAEAVLQASSAGYGDVRYWERGQDEDDAYDPGLISDGEVVEMYG